MIYRESTTSTAPWVNVISRSFVCEKLFECTLAFRRDIGLESLPTRLLLLFGALPTFVGWAFSIVLALLATYSQVTSTPIDLSAILGLEGANLDPMTIVGVFFTMLFAPFAIYAIFKFAWNRVIECTGTPPLVAYRNTTFVPDSSGWLTVLTLLAGYFTPLMAAALYSTAVFLHTSVTSTLTTLLILIGLSIAANAGRKRAFDRRLAAANHDFTELFSLKRNVKASIRRFVSIIAAIGAFILAAVMLVVIAILGMSLLTLVVLIGAMLIYVLGALALLIVLVRAANAITPTPSEQAILAKSNLRIAHSLRQRVKNSDTFLGEHMSDRKKQSLLKRARELERE